jgi:hypothetical protein
MYIIIGLLIFLVGIVLGAEFLLRVYYLRTRTLEEINEIVVGSRMLLSTDYLSAMRESLGKEMFEKRMSTFRTYGVNGGVYRVNAARFRFYGLTRARFLGSLRLGLRFPKLQAYSAFYDLNAIGILGLARTKEHFVY